MFLGWLAAVAGKYPMGDRTVFFAVPCLWLLATIGLSEVARYAGRYRPAVTILLVLALVAPQAVRSSGYLLRSAPKADFRGAFEYIDSHRKGSDVCWIATPQVFELYYGPARSCMGDYTPLDEVASAARGNRLWLVAPPWRDWPAPNKDDLRRTLETIGLQSAYTHKVAGLEVVLYELQSASR
jgi:hypothetical protein